MSFGRFALALVAAFGLACGSGASEGAPDAACPETSALGELAWTGTDEHGVARTIRASEYAEPCAAAAHLLVVRVEGGTWCGTCRWHAAHTSELVNGPRASRVRVLDLVVGDRDNAPATEADVEAWRALVDAPNIAIAADPGFSLRSLVPAAGTTLPLFLYVDTRTMTVIGQTPNPDPVTLAHDVDVALAAMDGIAPPATPSETLVDGTFHRNEWDMIHDVTTPGAPPSDPTNAVADSSAAAALGKALFFDASLSPSGKVACATCHDPTKQLSDGLPQAQGATAGNRRTPRIALAAFSRWQFWDGRADSLWSQALGPIENDAEMASSRLYVAKRMAAAYRTSYSAAYPDSPLANFDSLPESGKPGGSAYDALSDADKNAVTRVFVNVGKAIAAYERTFRVPSTPLDRYAAGDFGALTITQKQGLSVFMGAGCMQCHWGPRLTDDAFHVTRTATGRVDGQADRGRIDGAIALASSEFNRASAWSDAPSAAIGLDATSALLGAFKTPSLRGVGAGAPFGHGGTQATITDVMASYGLGGLADDDPRAVGAREPWLARFGTTAQWSIAQFLAVTAGDPIVR